MCSYSLLLVSSIFCCELFFFLNFFMCIWDICSWCTNYTVLQLLPSKVFITTWVPKWGQFCGGSNLDLDPDPDPYLGCTFWGSTLSLAPVPSMSHLRLWWGVNSGCRSSSIFGLKSFYLNLGSTPSLSPGHLFHTLGHVWGQLKIQLQIHMCVVPF